MANIDVRMRQHRVMEFLNAKGEMPIRIHGRLKIVYGDAISALLDEGFGAVTKLKGKQWLRKQGHAFYHTRKHALVKAWTITVETDGDYIEK